MVRLYKAHDDGNCKVVMKVNGNNVHFQEIFPLTLSVEKTVKSSQRRLQSVCGGSEELTSCWEPARSPTLLAH